MTTLSAVFIKTRVSVLNIGYALSLFKFSKEFFSIFLHDDLSAHERYYVKICAHNRIFASVYNGAHETRGKIFNISVPHTVCILA